ncbi:MAG: hypothetical protein WB679_15015 [Terracidiphilus sp.]
MEDALIAVSIAVSIPLLAVGMVFTCIAGFMRLRRKGFSPPASAWLLLSASLLALLSSLLVLPKVVFSAHGGLIFVVIFWLPAIVFAALILLMQWVLPQRNARVSGRRRPRFPFVAAGLGLFGLGVALVLWAIWQEASLGVSIKLSIILAGFGSALIALGQRAKSTSSIEEATQADPRAPVLYPRPFMQEGLPFVLGKKSTHGRYLSAARKAISSGDDDIDFRVSVRFEQYFREPLEGQIGPFVALGNPEDYLPPEGAVRTYASDSEWMVRVERLAAACSCMVAEAGISSNLEWELRYLRQEGLQGKLFIMTPPAALRVSWFDRLFLWVEQVDLVSWDAFTKTMTACGYEIADDPGPGSVLCFDTNGKSVIVRTGAVQPEEYVASIREFLEMRAGYTRESFDRSAPPVPELPPTPALPSAPTTDLPVELPKAVVPRRSWWSRLLSSVASLAILALLIGAIAYGPGLVKQHRERSRTQALRTFASQIGFTFSDGDLTIVNPDIAGTSLIDHGNNEGWASNAVQGERDGFLVLLFDFRYTVKSQDRSGDDVSHEISQTVAAFCGTSQRMPTFHLQEYSLWNALDLLDRDERIEMEGSPEFTKRFILQSKDKVVGIRMFSPELRSFLMSSYPRGNWNIEGGGPCLVLYQPKVRVNPENWASFLEQTLQTARGFYQHVRPDQAPQTAASK